MSLWECKDELSLDAKRRSMPGFERGNVDLKGEFVFLQLHFVEIDVEEDPQIAQAGGITGTPTVQLFKKKERLHHLPGVKMKREYRQLIEAAIN